MPEPNDDWRSLIAVCEVYQIKPETILYQHDQATAANRGVIVRELRRTGINTARIAQMLNLGPRQIQRMFRRNMSSASIPAKSK